MGPQCCLRCGADQCLPDQRTAWSGQPGARGGRIFLLLAVRVRRAVSHQVAGFETEAKGAFRSAGVGDSSQSLLLRP